MCVYRKRSASFVINEKSGSKITKKSDFVTLYLKIITKRITFFGNIFHQNLVALVRRLVRHKIRQNPYRSILELAKEDIFSKTSMERLIKDLNVCPTQPLYDSFWDISSLSQFLDGPHMWDFASLRPTSLMTLNVWAERGFVTYRILKSPVPCRLPYQNVECKKFRTYICF